MFTLQRSTDCQTPGLKPVFCFVDTHYREMRDQWRAVKEQHARKISATPERQARREVTAPGNLGTGSLSPRLFFDVGARLYDVNLIADCDPFYVLVASSE
jgi:hypothetical protein